MITKTEFRQRVIRKLMDYRSMIGVQVYFKHLNEEYLVVGAVPKDECIYLQGPYYDQHVMLTYNHFIGKKYDDIMNEFIVITTIMYFDKVLSNKSKNYI